MAEVHRMDTNRTLKVPEFLREPLEAAQQRFGQLEVEAQRVVKDLMVKGRASRKDLEHIVARLSRTDWQLPDLRGRLDWLREQGAERAAEWRGRADSFRAEALERMIELQGRAVAFLGVATREQVTELSREMERLAKRLEKAERGRRPGKRTQKPSAEV